MSEFKIRCSQIGQIMAKIGLTENQLITINELSSKEKLTEKQKKTLDDLIYKRDNPDFPKTIQSYLELWLKSKMYHRQIEIKSKYLDKGNITESDSIDFVGKKLGLNLVKNEKHFTNDFFTGTPDIFEPLDKPELVIDVKNSWDWSTFPLFDKEIPNMDYYDQLQGYMDLTGANKAKLIYILSDTPEELIERESMYYSKKQGMLELNKETFDKFNEKMTYSDCPDHLKFRVFDIEYDNERIEAIKLRVLECRNYLQTNFNYPNNG